MPSFVALPALFGGGHFAFRRHAKAAAVLAALVLSHWLLDFISHRPDLPLYPGGAKVGLGLWNNFQASLVAELVLFAGGIFLYESTTQAKDKVGSRSLVLFAIVLLATLVGNVFGPPPPDETGVIASAGFAMWLLFGWAYWFDSHRSLRAKAPA